MSTVSPRRQAFGIAALLGAVGVLGTAVLALQFDGRIEAARPRSRGAPSGLAPPRVTDVPANPEELRERLSAPLRLRPDGRALAAIEQLRRWHGLPNAPVVARPARDAWEVSVGDAAVGTLTEAHDFDALLALVERTVPPARAAAADAPPPEAASWPVLTPSRPAATVLAALDRAWAGGARSPATIRAAARALVALCVETPDAVDAADPLVARAFGALAWARKAGVPDLEAEALLARRMGYDEAAARRAAQLPAGSATVAWILRDDARLRALAAASDASESTRYLAYRRLVERGDRTGAVAWRDAQPPAVQRALPVAGFFLAAWHQRPIDAYRGRVQAAPSEALQALAAEAGDASAPAPTDAVLAGLARRTSQLPEGGFFYDRAAAAARADAVVLSALVDDLTFRLDVASDPADATAFANSLGDGAPAPYADFARWAAILAGARNRTLGPSEVRAALEAPAALGAPLRVALFEELAGSVAGDLSAGRAALERLVPHLDGRPAHRGVVAEMLGQLLADVPRQEAACDILLQHSRRAPSGAVALCLDERADTAGLLAIARDDSRDGDERRDALVLAAEHPTVNADALLAAWRAADEADPTAPPTGQATWLQRHGRAREAIALLRAWLDDHASEPGLAPVLARASLGALLREGGDAAGSWALVERDLPSFAGRSLREGALSLAALGRHDEAAQVAERAVARYGDAGSVAALAEVLWTRGDAEAAAAALQRNVGALPEDAWRWQVGAAFARVFGRRAEADARGAFEPLTQRRLPPASLRRMVGALGPAGRYDLAASLFGMIPQGEEPRTPVDVLFLQVQEYVWRARASGRAPAFAWLSAQVPPNLRGPLSMGAYAFHDGAVLWDLAVAEGSPSNVEFVWLLRQADALRPGATADHRAALDAHYAGDTSHDYAVMARYLRREVELPAVLRLAVSEKRRTEVPYYVGLRAQAEGRIAEATDWFTLAVLSGTLHDGEHTWASTALDAWRDRDEPVAALAARPWPPDDAPDATVVTPPDAPDAPADDRRHRRHREEGHRDRRHHRR
ncbi:MAG: hypothetical protein U0324_19575 [Polyangiales bacterium]